jgi:hypothetical protein
MYRYLVVEYCWEDDKYYASRHILGSYETIGEARKAAGKYIKENVKKKRIKYRDWRVDVHSELVFFPIRDV